MLEARARVPAATAESRRGGGQRSFLPFRTLLHLQPLLLHGGHCHLHSPQDVSAGDGARAPGGAAFHACGGRQICYGCVCVVLSISVGGGVWVAAILGPLVGAVFQQSGRHFSPVSCRHYARPGTGTYCPYVWMVVEVLMVCGGRFECSGWRRSGVLRNPGGGL